MQLAKRLQDAGMVEIFDARISESKVRQQLANIFVILLVNSVLWKRTIAFEVWLRASFLETFDA